MEQQHRQEGLEEVVVAEVLATRQALPLLPQAEAEGQEESFSPRTVQVPQAEEEQQEQQELLAALEELALAPPIIGVEVLEEAEELAALHRLVPAVLEAIPEVAVAVAVRVTVLILALAATAETATFA